MSRPGDDDDDDRTLPDAKVPLSRPAKSTFDDDSPLSFVPPPAPAPAVPRHSKVPPLFRALAPPGSSPTPATVSVRPPSLRPSPPPSRAPSEAPIELDEDALIDPDEVVREWARSLDTIDYLSLLNLPWDPELGDERVREAWRAFALAFHPDRHRDAPEDVWTATTQVFQRGAEAYRVLQDPALRRRYLELLATDGAVRMSPDQMQQSQSEGDGSRARDLVHSPAARAFAEKADELLAAGKLEAGRLQLQLASMREPGNERLARLLGEVEQRIAASRPLR